MKKAICLDYHGIISAYPEFFKLLMSSLVIESWEVHIATGSHIVEKNIVSELKSYGIEKDKQYTHLFSIADYHRDRQTPGMWHDENENPWVSDEDWDRTKADYCQREEIPYCIDDTARYANHFLAGTAFGYTSIQISSEQKNKYLNLIIDMFEMRRKNKSYNQSCRNKFKRIADLMNKNLAYWLSHPHKLGKEREI